MSSHYESIQLAALYPDAFKVAAPDVLPGRHVTPRKPGVFIRKGPAAGSAATDAGQTGIPDTPEAPEAAEPPANAETPASPARELVVGQFGLVPPWVKSASDAKLRSTKLVNARSETVTTSNNFREAWLGARRCIVPVMAFFEDDLVLLKPSNRFLHIWHGKTNMPKSLWFAVATVIVKLCIRLSAIIMGQF